MLGKLSGHSSSYAAFDRRSFVHRHGLGSAEAEALDALVVLVGGYLDEVALPERKRGPRLMEPPARTETVWFLPFTWLENDD